MDVDVVVVGCGNAGLCAALSAAEKGAKVVVLERAPEEDYGGNSRFTSGSMRFVFHGLDDLRRVMKETTLAELQRHDFGTYTENDFFDDMFRVTHFRTDPDLCEHLVRNSFATVEWLANKGVRFFPRFVHGVKSGDGFRFSGGAVTEASGGGPGLVDRERQLALRDGVEILYGAHAVGLIQDGTAIRGVRVRRGGAVEEIRARGVVLACGGFEANPEWRARYLGPGWDLVKVRGSRFNTGDGLQMALAAGAAPFGHWSGCHAVAGDLNAPDPGEPQIGDIFQRHSYHMGVMVNMNGRRFVDEGADLRHFTYAKYGRALLDQPGQIAWQVFDAKVAHLLREEYRQRRTTKITANTLEDLAAGLEGLDAPGFLDEIARYNAAVQTNKPFDPAKKDGRGTQGLALPKSNWANTIDQAPFEAYPIACGVTFTFGGVRVDAATAQVLGADLVPLPGLYAAGEMIGGVFYYNYPGATGLTSGAVFGRTAGASAAEFSMTRAARS